MKYKIAIDMRYVENPYSGLSRFSINIFYNLLKNSENDDIQFIVLMPPKKIVENQDLFKDINSKKIKKIYSMRKRGIKWKFPFFIIDLPLYLKLLREEVDIFLSPYVDPPILPGIKVICTIHDLIFVKVDNYFNNFRTIKKFFSELRIILSLLYSNSILTVSNTTKNLLIGRYKYIPFLKNKLLKTLVIYNGITEFKSSSLSNEYKYQNIKKEYFLYVGDRRNHKNLIYTINFLKVFKEQYKKDFIFVIAGSNSYKNYKLQKVIKSNSFVKEVINPIDSFLDYLYRNCISLIILSHEEGFGIPIIEAASRSKKVVASDIEIFREIAPGSSLLLDLKQEKLNLKLLHDYLNQEIYVDSQFILKKWSWDKSSLILREFLLSQLLQKNKKLINE